jgi:hypothetical protein
VRLAVGINDGPYRLRTAADAAWAPAYGYGGRVTLGRRIADAARAVLRTVVPVIGLTAAQSALFLYMATPVPYLGGTAESWMMMSALLLPFSFLAIHLTNRRYGPAYAFAQIVVTFAVLGAITLFAGDIVHRMLPAAALPDVRDAAAFVLVPFWLLRRVVQPLPGFGGF